LTLVRAVPGGPSDPDDEAGPQDSDTVIMMAVGDDRHWLLDPSDLESLADDEWCLCGQIGCSSEV
jgi:hypothetical protein